MKALIVSKALIVAAYREKLVQMARCGLEVTAVVPPGWREGGRLQPLEGGIDDAYKLVVTPLRWNGHFHLHYYPDLPKIIADARPDIVHLDEEPYNLATYLGIRAAARHGIPSVFFTWQNIARRYPPPFQSLERWVYRTSCAAIAGNEDARSVLRSKSYRQAVAVIPQFGVDPEVFAPAPRRHDCFTVGFLNRLVPAKGVNVALEAFGKLPSDTRMRIVGDGPMVDEIEESVERLRLRDRVTIESRVPSAAMPALLNELDVVILPSLTTPRWKEQFGRVLVEAMACGVPVIGSDSGEIPNVIDDAGLVVSEGDSVALAAALRRLYDDPPLRRDLAERGRERVRNNFTHARVARAMADFYAGILRQ